MIAEQKSTQHDKLNLALFGSCHMAADSGAVQPDLPLVLCSPINTKLQMLHTHPYAAS